METIPEFVYPKDKFVYRKKVYRAVKKKFVERDNAYCITTDTGPLWLRPNEVLVIVS